LGHYNRAANFADQALRIRAVKLRPGHLEFAFSWLNLANVPIEQQLYPDAAELLEKTLSVFRASVGEEHEHTAIYLPNFGRLRLAQQRLAEADSCLAQSMSIHNKLSGGTSLNAVFAANHLADVRTEQTQFEESDALLNKSLQVRESKLSPGHPHIALSLTVSAGFAPARVCKLMPEQYYKRALAIRAAALPFQHPHRARLLEDHAALLATTDRSSACSPRTNGGLRREIP
jgi:tetratricopeptide (TPR) repeat protein